MKREDNTADKLSCRNSSKQESSPKTKNNKEDPNVNDITIMSSCNTTSKHEDHLKPAKQASLEKEKQLLGRNVDDGGNEVERTKLSLLRYLAERQDPSSKEVDDATLRRFLRARDLDVEKASAMLVKYLKWKAAFVPKGYIATSEIANELEQNKMFLQGTDRQGRPIALVFGARHFQNKIGGVDEFKRFIVYAFGKLFARMERGQEKFVVIGDLEGWGYANTDIRGYLAALNTLQDYYPERLGKLFLVHVPYLFMAVWKVVCPFIDTNTRKKIVFVENKNLKSTLLEDIDDTQIPDIYGGKLPLVPIHLT